jgi:LmbE family N-acetylglucosaminyl deacetylase
MSTIIPMTAEEEWLKCLGDLPAWQPARIPTVILSPHPDDETLGAGGLIARLRAENVAVTVVAVTDGEGAYDDSAGLARIRVQEQTEALKRLGVHKTSILRLKLPDRDVTACEDKLVQELSAILQPGMQLVAPWPGDFHPDHEATGRAAQRVAHDLGLALVFYLFWTWHRGTPATLDDVALMVLPLTEAERQARQHALEAHRSQFEHPGGEPILSPRLIEPAQRSFEVYIPA